MLPKQRILAAMRGEQLDRLPWSPFLAYWWEAQAKERTDGGQLKFLKEIGADPMLRGSHMLWKSAAKNQTFTQKGDGKINVSTYETPVGKLTYEHTYVQDANTWFLTKHPVRSKEDFKVLQYMYENIEAVPDYQNFDADNKSFGDDCLLVPLVGANNKTSFQSLIEHWVGTEELIYALADYPGVVEECLHAMMKVSVETAKIAAGSNAEALIFWEDSSTTNTSPEYFEKYAAPEINAWGKLLHKSGKLLIHHACGHLKGLLPAMAKTEIDMIESISPPPTGNIELWEAAELLPEHIGLIGGIEPTVFLNSAEESLAGYTTGLLRRMEGKRFVLANSDSCPPGVSEEKFRLITELNGNHKSLLQKERVCKP